MARYKTHKGDMFNLFFKNSMSNKGVSLVVTTNVTKTTPKGDPISPEKYGVMGAGCAKKCAETFPEFQQEYADAVKCGFKRGIFVYPWANQSLLIALVVKDNWWEKAPSYEERILELTELGLQDLRELADIHTEYHQFILPYPAIGNAKVDKSKVEPLLEKYLDERFIVCTL